MAIDGLIVLDASGRPIVQSSFRSSPPSVPLLHIDAVHNALLSSPQQTPSLIPLTTHNGPAAACCVSHADIRFVCAISGNDDPLFAVTFLDSFINILRIYFSSLDAQSLKQNIDVVYQLIEEILDDSRPLTTDPNMLRDIVIPTSFLNKIKSISGIAKSSHTPFSSPIHWRRSGVRYNANEIYFDFVEDMNAVVSKSGSIVDSQIWGKLQTNSKLSGTPDLSLSFQNPDLLANVTFHPCVRIPKWVRDKSLSFVPPDGHFVLLSYQHKPLVTNTLSNQAAYVPLPFTLTANLSTHESSGSLDIVVSSKMREPSEKFVLEFYVGDSVTSANCNISASSSWGFDPKTQILRWEIAAVASASTHTLKSTFSSPSGVLRTARSITTKFALQHRSFSNVKVDQLKISGELYKPYKGVRGSAIGTIEWRL